VLCGTTDFWLSVIFAVVVALGTSYPPPKLVAFVNTSIGPRFLVKFVSSAYMPQDRDIIREMWVQGDLKDRLGIQHRRDIKSVKNTGRVDLEHTPMFHRPHFRSESEISSFQPELDLHHSALSRSPVNSDQSTPPQSIPPSPGFSRHHEDDLLTPTARAAMNPSATSFRGSYYSASNIPVPSPINGPGGPPMSSIATTPVTAYPQQPSSSLQIPALRSRTPNTPESFEMHVRQPSDDLVTPTAHSHQRDETDVSYETAYDGCNTLEPSSGQHHRPEESWRDSTYSTASGPTVL
jgi:phospholipid-translocating ATPase